MGETLLLHTQIMDDTNSPDCVDLLLPAGDARMLSPRRSATGESSGESPEDEGSIGPAGAEGNSDDGSIGAVDGEGNLE